MDKKPKSEQERLDRRGFLAKTGALGVGVVGLTSLLACESSAVIEAPAQTSAPPAPAEEDAESTPNETAATTAAAGISRVAYLRHQRMVPAGSKVDRDVALAMVDEGVKHVWGTDTPQGAWKQVASPSDVVALKVNCICSRLSTNPEVAYAVAQRLEEAGVQAGNIIIFDRTTRELEGAGYSINRDDPSQFLCYGTDGDYEGPYSYGKYSGNLSRILTEKATVMVNLPVLKDHSGAQVTLSMKNHYGTIDNPGPYHGNNCDPFIGHMNMLPPIKDKTKLIVLDASRGCWSGGPGPGPNSIWTHQGMVVATDPVALDTIGNGIINAKRSEQGHGPVSGAREGIAKHILTAEGLGLGTAQRSKMDLLEETLA